ncbi:hypothetical protein Cgig2_018436 [Carnegiea gigantea]|uniref:Uncharacterized protein n=1 Tax=Carnegiea gigantea TaxID=171969 RepID=A0A9Q1K793_9CARY|nr:hypothetical protein Cgig2_018436 [Carnegiea gigantea]
MHLQYSDSKRWKQLTMSRGRSFIFSTAMPVPNAAAAYVNSGVQQSVEEEMRGSFSSWIDALRHCRQSASWACAVETSNPGEGSFSAPNLGLSLDFVPPLEHNGWKLHCVEERKKQCEIEFRKSSIICFSLGSNPGYDRVVAKPNGVFIVRFHSVMERDEVLGRDFVYFEKKPLWVKFPEFDFRFWSREGISKISSIVGRPLVADKATHESGRI